jgi:hypothetical protein
LFSGGGGGRKIVTATLLKLGDSPLPNVILRALRVVALLACSLFAGPARADFTFIHSSDPHFGAGENHETNAKLYADTAIFAAAWSIPLFVPRILRARRRRRRGLCPRCGYDLNSGDHGRCPECGDRSATHADVTSPAREPEPAAARSARAEADGPA